jgi:hypothetical protein
MLGDWHFFSAVLFGLIVGGFTTAAAEQPFMTEAIPNEVKPTVKNSADSLRAKPTNPSHRPRLLLILMSDDERSQREMARLQVSGGVFDQLRAVSWKIGKTPEGHIQIVDRADVPEWIDVLKPPEYPAVACLLDREVIRSFHTGCTTPLDTWTFGWLLKGVNERPTPMIPEIARVEAHGNYRLRGNHWSIEGDPNPSKETLLNHLRGPNHHNPASAYGAIENWSYEELRSLHDDLHESAASSGLTISGSTAAPAANRNLNAFSGNRKVTGK